MNVPKKLILFSVFLVCFSIAGCSPTPKDASISNIYEKQQEKANEEKLSDATSKKITENIKKNSEKSFLAIQDARDQVKENEAQKQGDEPKTFEGQVDQAVNKVNHTVWSSLFMLILSLQGASIPISLGLIFLGSAMAYLFKKDPPKFKTFILVAIGGVVFFLVVNYLPAFLWYLQN